MTNSYEKLDALLTRNGWTLECESPLEIRHDESGSFATGFAANLVIDNLRATAVPLQLYVDDQQEPPPVAAWPLDDDLVRPFVDSGQIVTFTAVIPLDELVSRDIDGLNEYCQQAFGDGLDINDTEFRVVPGETDGASGWNRRFTGDVTLQVTCTVHSAN